MKTLHEQIAGWCVHYRGPMKYAECACGVNYRQLVGGPDFGWMARLPCVKESPLKKQPVAECQSLRWPTVDEVETEVKVWERVIAMEIELGERKTKNGKAR